MIDRIDWMTRGRAVVLAGAALGLALAAPAAWADARHAKASAHSVQPAAPAAGVIIHAPPPSPHPSVTIPSAREATFTAEAAHDDAWRAYRSSTPSVTDSTLDQAKGYPGLHALAPAD